MSTWKTPGESTTMTIGGRKVVIKPIKWSHKTRLARQIQSIPEDEDSFTKLLELFASQIESIEGFDGDLMAVLDEQPIEVIKELQEAILGLGSIDEATAKN